jgi:LmbE family N-acetylglucosaminyl deacetylase
MNEPLRLMCVLAHPDDESLGMGGTLARYSAEGVETYLLTATRGERGRYGSGIEFPGFSAVGRIRERELMAAATELRIREVRFLDYMDGDLDQTRPGDIIGKIAVELRRVRPQVVVTFGPEGAYGHPDHIAICQFTTAAIVCATNPSYSMTQVEPDSSTAHRVSKLYYMAWTHKKWAGYQAAFRDLKSTVDGVERRATPWSDWAVTTVIDTQAYWETVWRAVCCHKTQLAIYSQLGHLSEEHHRAMWGTQEYYRVFSLVNGGRRRESDLFEGLRPRRLDSAE